MGRSGGKDKRLQSLVASRSKTMRFIGSLTGTEVDYSVDNDHHTLLVEAIELWVQEPGLLTHPATAHFYHHEYLPATPGNHPNINRDESYWRRAIAALEYELQNSTPEKGTYFRGQKSDDPDPTNRPRGWSQDPEIVFDFVKEGLSLRINGEEIVVSLDEAISMAQGGGGALGFDGQLVATVYVTQDPGQGFDISSRSLNSARKTAALNYFEQGGAILNYYVLNETSGSWEEFKELNDFYKMKAEIAQKIIEKSGEEAVERFTKKQAFPDMSMTFYTSIDNFDAFVEEFADEELKVKWRKELEKAREALNNSESIYIGDECYIDEKEVILPPEGIGAIDRVEITLASSDEELSGLTEEKAKSIIKKALKVGAQG